VLDLFCGLGNFTLPLARRCGSIVGVEGDSGLVAKARPTRPTASAMPIFSPRIYSSRRVRTLGGRPIRSGMLDPPRAGALEVVSRMASWRPRRVVYISCHPGSLARDAGILVENQGFRLVAAGVMDMFPHTTHVESIAVFERRE
jgi:23S rRNA (uracil1939-C5)-methyltransferase